MHVDEVETARMAIYLNAILGGHSVGKFWGDGARFVSAPGGRLLARDPEDWLAQQENCRGFGAQTRRSNGPSQLPIWFRESHWVLKTYTPDVELAWRPSYEIRDQPGGARQLWLVTYCPELDGTDVVFTGRDLKEIADELSSVLNNLIALTGSRIPPWQDTFIELEAKLKGKIPKPMAPPVPQEVLADLPARLVDTAFSANIFGGMGNWGDNSYDPDIQPSVEQLTASLFVLLAEGLVGAVDSTRPAER